MLDDIEGAAPTAKGLLRVTVDGGAPRPVISSRAPRLVLVGSIHAP